MHSVSNRGPHEAEIDPAAAGAHDPMPSMPKVPSALRGVFRRAESGRSRKAGMAAYCWQCVGFEQVEIRRCSAPECALWEWRPVKPKTEPTEQDQRDVQECREAELEQIVELNRRYVAVFRRAYKGRSRVDAVRAFSVYCMNGSQSLCATRMCPLARYCPGATK